MPWEPFRTLSRVWARIPRRLKVRGLLALLVLLACAEPLLIPYAVELAAAVDVMGLAVFAGACLLLGRGLLQAYGAVAMACVRRIGGERPRQALLWRIYRAGRWGRHGVAAAAGCAWLWVLAVRCVSAWNGGP